MSLNNYNRYFDLKLAIEQHAALTLSLRLAGFDVIELAASEDTPLCCFTGEVAIIIDGVALLAKLKHENRIKEMHSMKTVLRREGLNVKQCSDRFAYFSAGDILFTGKEIFVGLSTFTNLAGAKFVAATFPDYPVNLVKVPKRHHLKYYVCMAMPNTLVFGSSQVAAYIKEQIMELSAQASDLKTFNVYHDCHVGCFYANRNTFHVSPSACPVCSEQFRMNLTGTRREVLENEFYKIYRGMQAKVLFFQVYPENTIPPFEEQQD